MFKSRLTKLALLVLDLDDANARYTSLMAKKEFSAASVQLNRQIDIRNQIRDLADGINH